MNIVEAFAVLGVTQNRTKIIALVSSPQVFVNLANENDALMCCESTVWKFYSELITANVKNKFCNEIHDALVNIRVALFSPEKARDVLYALRSEKYLDELITWGTTIILAIDERKSELRNWWHDLLKEETGAPVYMIHGLYGTSATMMLKDIRKL